MNISNHFAPRRAGRPKSRVALLAAFVLLGSASLPLLAHEHADHSQADHTHTEDAPAAPATFEYNPSEPLYSAFGEEVTAADWFETIRFFPPDPMRGADPFSMDPEQFTPAQIENSIRIFVERAGVGQAARDADYQLSTRAAQNLERDLSGVALRAMLEGTPILNSIEVSDAEVQEHYEEIREERYRVVETMRMRHIFLSTYETYTVEEGDTLESIAEKISGDSAAADQILSVQTRQPRIEGGETPEGEQLDPRALTPGEQLMIPMNEENANAVKQRAEEALAKVQQGEDFVEIAQEYGENERAGEIVLVRPAMDDKPILDVINEAFLSLEDGESSDVLRTKHGWQIVQRVNYTPGGYRPIEEVEEQLRSSLVNDKRNEMFREYLAELITEYPGVIEIERELMMNPEGEDVADEVIFQIGDNKYTASMFVRDFGSEFDAETPYEQRVRLLARLPMVQQTLIAHAIDERDVRDTELYQKRARMVEDFYLSQEYPAAAAAEAELEPTEEELQEQFEQMRSQFEREASFEVWQLVQRTPEGLDAGELETRLEQMRTQLEDALRDVESAEDFQEEAEILSDDEETAAEGGFVGRKSTAWLNGYGQRLASNAEPNSLWGPVVIGDDLYAFWIGEKYEDWNPSLDDVRDRVLTRWENLQRQQYAQQVVENAREEADLEILFND